MSYKHFNDIQNLYEAVSENDNKDQEFTKEIVTVISTSMFVEGYSTTAIEGYFQQSTADEIAEKYHECLEDFAFVDDSVLTEDVEYEYVLTEESLEDLNEVIGGIVKGLATVGRKALAPAARLAGRNVRKIANAGKWSKVAAKGTGETVKKVASKGKGFLGKAKELASTVKDKVGKGVNFVKDKVGKVAKWAKKNPGKATAAVLAPATIGGLVASKVAKNKSKSKNKLPIETVDQQKEKDKHVDAQGKKYPSTAEIRAKHSKASSTGNAGSSTDSGGTAGKEDTPKVKDEPAPKKKMHALEKKNRARFGDKAIDHLKAKQVDFKAMRRGDMSKDDFIKKYPKSITAQKAAGLRDHQEWDAFDMVSAYLIDSNQVENMDEALYVMTEMDAQTIQGIVEDFKKKA